LSPEAADYAALIRPTGYLAEFDFRYNTRKITDMERTELAVRGGEGKRLTYHQPD
jgi:hypothetical protein